MDKLCTVNRHKSQTLIICTENVLFCRWWKNRGKKSVADERIQWFCPISSLLFFFVHSNYNFSKTYTKTLAYMKIQLVRSAILFHSKLTANRNRNRQYNKDAWLDVTLVNHLCCLLHAACCVCVFVWWSFVGVCSWK